MSGRTTTNEVYKGLVENISIPAELHERDGKKYASSDGVVPIHCCSQEQIAEYAKTTHHYCGVFTERVLAPLEELVYVRLDDNKAEKVFINRTKRLLVTSHDGRLAQWRAAPAFESGNRLMAGAPVVTARGDLVTVLTARRGNHYAVSTFEGDGGYFETSLPWTVLDVSEGYVYADRVFPTHEALRQHIAALPPTRADAGPPRPVLVRPASGRGSARVALVAEGGRQIAHFYLQGVLADGIEYL